MPGIEMSSRTMSGWCSAQACRVAWPSPASATTCTPEFVGQQAAQALARQWLVVGDDHFHRMLRPSLRNRSVTAILAQDSAGCKPRRHPVAEVADLLGADRMLHRVACHSTSKPSARSAFALMSPPAYGTTGSNWPCAMNTGCDAASGFRAACACAGVIGR